MPPTPDGSLAGVVAARTAIAHVDGERGVALVRGYSLPRLAALRTYEDIAHLVLIGELPYGDGRARFRERIQAASAIELREAHAAHELGELLRKPDALAAAVVLAEDAEARAAPSAEARVVRVLARLPAICAAVTGVSAPPVSWSYAGRALFALGGKRLDERAVRAFEVLLSLESEHGLSASTFACRVAASSGAGAGASLGAAVATLSGQRHGGATAEALELLREASTAGPAVAFVRAKRASGARLAGFGHRIYKVADPRVPPLRAAMQAMGGESLLRVADALEAAVAEVYGDKRVHANIDLFGAALLAALGVEPAQFVAAFALGVAPGWLAHWSEQAATGKLIRPGSEYSGPEERSVPEGGR